MNVICAEDCGNAPRKQYLLDFNTAFAKGDTATVLAMVSEDIRWELVGEEAVEGKAAFAEALTEMLSGESATTLTVRHILTHGDTGAIHGTMAYPDGSNVAFCDVCVFDGNGPSATIKEMVSYGVELDEPKA